MQTHIRKTLQKVWKQGISKTWINVQVISNQRHHNSLMKSQKNAFDLHPDRIQDKNFASRGNKRDVNQLLIKHYENDWRDIQRLEFFKQVLDNATPTTEGGEQTA